MKHKVRKSCALEIRSHSTVFRKRMDTSRKWVRLGGGVPTSRFVSVSLFTPPFLLQLDEGKTPCPRNNFSVSPFQSHENAFCPWWDFQTHKWPDRFLTLKLNKWSYVLSVLNKMKKYFYISQVMVDAGRIQACKRRLVEGFCSFG